MIDYSEAKAIAAMLAAIGESTRLRILYHLVSGPHNVGQLAKAVGTPMVNMSHHLGVMRTAGLLEDQKDGRRVIYRFKPDLFIPGGDGPDTLGTLSVGSYRMVILRPPPSPRKARKSDPDAGNGTGPAKGRPKKGG